MAGFVKDATDPVNSGNATSTLLASGGTATKFWQSCEVVVTNLPDLYYTSSDPEEARWASPGSFVISVVGAPSSSASFEVFAHWDVSFYEPTYEHSTLDAGFVTSLKDLYTSAGNKYLSRRKGSDWEPADWGDFSPPLFEGAVLTVLSMRGASVRNSTGALSGLFNYRTLKATDNRIYPVDDKGSLSTQAFFDEVYSLFQGEKLEVSRPPNDKVASWFRSALKRHQRLGLSRFLQSDPEWGQEEVLGMTNSSSMPCMYPQSGRCITPPLKGSMRISSRSQRRLRQDPSLRETLSRLTELLTESPPLSRASSQIFCDEEFQLV